MFNQYEEPETVPQGAIPLPALGSAIRAAGYVPPGADKALYTYCSSGRSAHPRRTKTGRWFIQREDLHKVIIDLQLPTIAAFEGAR